MKNLIEKDKLELNERQLKAVNSEEPNILIIAPAGSGKTSTLIAAYSEV